MRLVRVPTIAGIAHIAVVAAASAQPDPIENAHVRPAGTDVLHVVWDVVTGATGAVDYEIRRDGGAWVDVPGDSTRYIDIGLAINTSYAYEVRATDTVGSVTTSLFSGQTFEAPLEGEGMTNGVFDGKSSLGGLYGSLRRVTNLSNSGAGSLRDALGGGSTPDDDDIWIVFDVGGTIELASPGGESSAMRSYGQNVTIDGYSAPSPGITVSLDDSDNASKAWALTQPGDGTQGVDNWLFRGIRSDESITENGDAGVILGGDLGATPGVRRVIFDHCSFVRGSDSVARSAGLASQIVYQYCIIGGNYNFPTDAFIGENKGTLIGSNPADSVGVTTLHHNLMAFAGARVPRVQGSHELTAVINNIIAYWDSDATTIRNKDEGSDASYDPADLDMTFDLVKNLYVWNADGLDSTDVGWQPTDAILLWDDTNQKVHAAGNRSITGPLVQDDFAWVSTRRSTPLSTESEADPDSFQIWFNHVGPPYRTAHDDSIVARVQSWLNYDPSTWWDTDDTPPTAPTGITVHQADSTAIRFSWVGMSDPADSDTGAKTQTSDLWYQTMYAVGDPSAPTDTLSWRHDDNFRSTDDNSRSYGGFPQIVAPGIQFYFWGRFGDLSGNEGATGGPFGVLIPGGGGGSDTTPPAAPTIFSLVPSTYEAVRATVTATTDDTSPQDSLEYRVSFGLTPAADETESAWGAKGAVVFTVVDSDWTAETLVYMKAKARDEAGNESAYGAVVPGYTDIDTSPPPRPGSLTVTAGSEAGQLVLLSDTVVDDQSGVAGYIFRPVVNPGGASESPTGPNLRTVSNLIGGEYYVFEAMAVDNYGNVSAPSDTAGARTLASTVAGGAIRFAVSPPPETWVAGRDSLTGFVRGPSGDTIYTAWFGSWSDPSGLGRLYEFTFTPDSLATNAYGAYDMLVRGYRDGALTDERVVKGEVLDWTDVQAGWTTALNARQDITNYELITSAISSVPQAVWRHNVVTEAPFDSSGAEALLRSRDASDSTLIDISDGVLVAGGRVDTTFVAGELLEDVSFSATDLDSIITAALASGIGGVVGSGGIAHTLKVVDSATGLPVPEAMQVTFRDAALTAVHDDIRASGVGTRIMRASLNTSYWSLVWQSGYSSQVKTFKPLASGQTTTVSLQKKAYSITDDPDKTTMRWRAVTATGVPVDSILVKVEINGGNVTAGDFAVSENEFAAVTDEDGWVYFDLYRASSMLPAGTTYQFTFDDLRKKDVYTFKKLSKVSVPDDPEGDGALVIENVVTTTQ